MPAKFSLLAVSALPLVPIALACGGDDGGGGIKVIDASTTIDSKPVDAASTCYVETSLAPTFGSADQFAETNGSGITGSNAHTEVWGGRLNPDMMPDIVQVELYAGVAAFMGTDITPKTIQIAGEELNYRTCGACVRIFADATQQAVAAQYFATGGTLTLTSTTGNLTGTLSNITMTKVTIAQDFTSTPVNDGCNTTITNAAMNAPLMMGSATAGNPSALVIPGEISVRPVVLTKRRY
ncbi:MAG TPA: hypothetical protein VIV11_12475 [Kofleriaceae bacterium]